MGSPKSLRPKCPVKMVAQKQMRGLWKPLGGNPQGCCRSDSGYSCVQHRYRAKTQDTSVSPAKGNGPLRLKG